MNMLKYNNYTARIEFDEDDGTFVGHIAGINDVIGFHADSVSDLTAAFHEAVDDYLETCKAVGKAPEKAFSGNFMVRIDPAAHAKAALAAQVTGRSLSQWAEEKLLQGADEDLQRA